MNTTPMELYWITRLDGLLIMLIITGAVLTIGFLCFFFACVECNDNKGVKYARRGILIGILSLVLAVFIPTKEEMAAIVVIPMVVNNEKVQEIASGSLEGVSNLVKLSNKWLEENLKEKAK